MRIAPPSFLGRQAKLVILAMLAVSTLGSARAVAAVITGRVFEPGGVNEIRGLPVVLRGETGTVAVETDVTGRFTFDAVARGEYAVARISDLTIAC